MRARSRYEAKFIEQALLLSDRRLRAADWFLWRQTAGRSRQHPGSAFRFRCAGQDMGDQHHLHPDRGGLCVSGGRDRLFSRRVIGWSLQSRSTADLVLQAFAHGSVAPKAEEQGPVHSDDGSQFTSVDWVACLKHDNLEHSMRRRGNCHDNAVAENFFNLTKRERIRRRTMERGRRQDRTCSTT